MLRKKWIKLCFENGLEKHVPRNQRLSTLGRLKMLIIDPDIFFYSSLTLTMGL